MLVRLIKKLRSWKRSYQRTQLELNQQIDIMERRCGLHFFHLKRPMPCTLAVVRYSSWADINELETRLFDVTEEAYADSYNEIAQLERDVMDALHGGTDVTIATAEPIETFPRLAALISHDLT